MTWPHINFHCDRARDKTGIARVLGTPGGAALALGFSPWSNPAVAGGRHVLWHNGLGGSVGLAHTASHYSISVCAFSRSLPLFPLPPHPLLFPLPPSRTTQSHFFGLRTLSRPTPPARPLALPLPPLPRQVLKNAYEPGTLGSHDGIVTLPDDVLDLISVVENFVAAAHPTAH